MSETLATTTETDEAVAARVQAGDRDAYGVLIDRYEGKLMRYASRLLLDADEAKDVVQEALIKAYVNIQSFDTSQRFSPWVYRITHNECMNVFKRRSRLSMFTIDIDTLIAHPAAPETADGDAIRNEEKAVVEQALRELKEKYREPLVLYYFDDMDYKRIAEVLQVPVATVGVRIMRGKKLLRAAIEKLHSHGK